MDYNNDYYSSVLHMISTRIFIRFGTQKKFAKELGIDPGNLSKFLSGKLQISSKTFVEICLVLGIGIFVPQEIRTGYDF